MAKKVKSAAAVAAAEPRASKKRKIPEIPSRKADRKSKRKSSREDAKHKGRKKPAGPRLPSVIQKEIDELNPKPQNSNGDDEEIDSDLDVYEYEEEGEAPEDSKKNRRYDPVDNLDYELPDDFKDENVNSDEDVSEKSDADEEDGSSHARMLHSITGIPSKAFEVNKRTEPVLVDTFEAGTSHVQVSIHDLLDPLHGKSGYSELRKRVQQLEKKPMIVHAPISKVERERLERKAAYDHSKKDITKWEPLVKRNRETPTLYFQEDRNLGYSTVGAVASEFEPRTEFEKKMALLVNDPEIVQAHKKDGQRILELNEVSMEDFKERQNRLAKMRNLLFQHDIKQKRIKKIKSKTYHRILKKDKAKASSDEMLMDPEAVREQALKQEYKRAEERLTLKHKNKSKWAQRNLKRGLKAQDEGTRAAMAEQLRQHELLTRKMNSMRDSSSEESSDDENEDGVSHDADDEDASKILLKAIEKTSKVIGEEDGMPREGVLSMPFMIRGLKKKKEAADEEARLALQEYSTSLQNLDDDNGTESPKLSIGRKTYGELKNQSKKSSGQVVYDGIDKGSSESESDFEIRERKYGVKRNEVPEVQIDPSILLEEQEINQEASIEGFDDITKNPGSKTTHDVAIFASGSWKKMNAEKLSQASKNSVETVVSAPHHQNEMVSMHDNDGDSDQEIVDGILSANAKIEYELPTQNDLIRRAFASDDVEMEFENDKMEILNEENPEPEKPVLLPGWGQWTHVQKKRGLPSYMLKEHEDAKRKREESLKKRKDAHLKHVIISERIGKKADKLHASSLPFPFKSKEVFELSLRMPIGPDYNPTISVGALTRPSVVKEAGIIIKPIKFEEVDPHDKSDEPKGKEQKSKPKKSKTGIRGSRP